MKVFRMWWKRPSPGSDQYQCSIKCQECRACSSYRSASVSRNLARTETLWLTLPRSPGCSMLQLRKTSHSAALSVNKGKLVSFVTIVGTSSSLVLTVFRCVFQVQGCDWRLLSAARHWSAAVWWPNWDWREGTLIIYFLFNVSFTSKEPW